MGWGGGGGLDMGPLCGGSGHGVVMCRDPDMGSLCGGSGHGALLCVGLDMIILDGRM